MIWRKQPKSKRVMTLLYQAVRFPISVGLIFREMYLHRYSPAIEEPKRLKRSFFSHESRLSSQGMAYDLSMKLAEAENVEFPVIVGKNHFLETIEELGKTNEIRIIE